MGAGIAPARVQLEPGLDSGAGHPPHLDPVAWQRAAERLALYLAAMGVREAREVDELRERVRLRVEVRAAFAPPEDPVEAAIEEAHALLDLWLISELGLEGDANALCAARAAVLGGGVPGWGARWAGHSGRSLAAEIRALCLASVPEPAPLTMEPNPIDLFLHRLLRRLSAGLNRLLGRSAGPKTGAGGHP